MDQQSPLASSISLLDVLGGILRHKLLISCVTLLASGASVGYIAVTKPVYATEAQILFENLASPFDRTQATDDPRAEPIDDRLVLSQMSILRSPDLGERIIDGLMLVDNAEFDPLKNGAVGPLQELLLSLGFGEDPRQMTPKQRALKRYGKQLLVYQVPESNVVAVKYSANDPKTAANVANTLAKLFVDSSVEVKLQPTNRAREWIGGQIEDIRKKLAVSEKDIESFRAQSGLLKGSTSTLGTQELSELNTQITLAETARTEAQERAKSINEMLSTKGTVDDSIDVLGSPNVQRLREQQVTAARLVAELSATYLPNHPKMIAAQNQLTSVNRQIRSEALKVVQGLGEQARISMAREESLRARLEEMKGDATTANQDDVKLQAMERDAKADKALLESLLLRYADASTRQNTATQPGLARIIQQATPPTTPSFPKPGPTVLIATLAGLALSLGLSFLLEIMAAASRLAQPAPFANRPAQDFPTTDPVFEDISKVKPTVRASMQRPLAVFPVATTLQGHKDLLDQPLAADHFGMRAAANTLADWAVGLQKKSSLRQLAILSVGGSPADSSLAAIAIARALTTTNIRVVVVDLDSVGSDIDTLIGLPSGPGFSDLLAGTADFTKVIVRDPVSPAHLLRFGNMKTDASHVLVHQRADAVLNALGSIYDIVIVHLGEESSSTAGLVEKCQAALIFAPAMNIADASNASAVMSAGGQLNVQIVGLDHVVVDISRRAVNA
jgi:polysaccharide biosynthesis transport protein